MTGREFETYWMNKLRGDGYWVFRFPTGTGQPCDLLGIRNNCSDFWECKVSATDGFDCSRFEANQHTASKYIQSCGNNNYYVVIHFKSGINIYRFEELRNVKNIKYQEGKNNYENYFR